MKLDKFHLKTGVDKDILGVGQDCVHFGFGDVQHLVKFLQGKSSNANIPEGIFYELFQLISFQLDCVTSPARLQQSSPRPAKFQEQSSQDSEKLKVGF